VKAIGKSCGDLRGRRGTCALHQGAGRNAGGDGRGVAG
jgi:hypothetical protein